MVGSRKQVWAHNGGNHRLSSDKLIRGDQKIYRIFFLCGARARSQGLGTLGVLSTTEPCPHPPVGKVQWAGVGEATVMEGGESLCLESHFMVFGVLCQDRKGLPRMVASACPAVSFIVITPFVSSVQGVGPGPGTPQSG